MGRRGLPKRLAAASTLLTSPSVSQSAGQVAAFFREVARHRLLWCVRDDQGSPAPKTTSGKRAVPYWSSRARAKRAAEIWAGGLPRLRHRGGLASRRVARACRRGLP